MRRPHRMDRAAVATLLWLLGCSSKPAEQPGIVVPSDPPPAAASGTSARPVAPALPLPPIRLTDVAADVGIKFTYDTGASGEALMVESTGGGAGWLDFDRDGEWDLYFCQGGNAKEPPPHQPLDLLLRSHGGRPFEDVTAVARIHEPGYGQGVSIGDFDEDGFDDVYVSNVGPNRLWRNCGDGTFEDVTAASGVGDPGWSTSTAWADLDGDGDLDLYVCNYAIYDVHNPRICTDRDGSRTICDPLEVDGQRDVCYENLGDGAFRDVTADWGFDGTDDRSLGVAVLDLTGDDRPDVFVANDVSANFLYVNESPGRFRENGVASGVAMNTLGNYQASMGVGIGDYDADGLPDLYCTHFTNDSNTLYRNLGAGSFEDVTRFLDLHQPTLQYLGFGTVLLDFDSNGQMDAFIANGHIADWRSRGNLWKMPAQLFSWQGERFAELHAAAGPYFERELLARAVAVADYDHDGDPDLAVVHQHDAASLLRNDSDRGHWLKLQFIGTQSNRRGVGVRVQARCGDITRSGWLPGGGSYCAGHEPAIFLGLGTADGPCEITVRWPSGVEQLLTDVPLDQSLTLHEPEVSSATGAGGD